jgi:ubiquinone/menaquinone biosynthesis C-methylase UbiE
MLLPDNEAARSALFDHVNLIESDPNFGEINPEMLEHYGEMIDEQMTVSHKTNRTSQDLTVALGTPINRFERLFAGKSVLDVGCGEGIFSAQLASRNKKTQVTGLDYNPSVFAKVPTLPNLRTIEGSGYDLQGALGGEEFDVVFVAFSSQTWARNPEQARQSITSALDVTKVGGSAIFIPIMQHIKSHEVYKRALAEGRMPGYADGEVAPEGIEYARNVSRVEDYMRSTKLRTLETAEKSGQIACAYVAGDRNRKKIVINPRLGKDHPTYEDYSVIATVLEK